MTRERRGASARAFDEDATVVDFTVSDRARSPLASGHEGAGDGSFDDIPTTVWAPRPAPPAAGASGVRVSARRLRRVPDETPSVRVERAGAGAFDRGEEVTRIGVPRPLPSSEEPTLVGKGRAKEVARRRRSRVRIACAAIAVLLVAALAFAAFRKHRHSLAPSAPAAAAHPPPAPAPHAPTPISPLAGPSPAPVAPTPPSPEPARPAMPTSPNDEYAAVEAVQRGEIARAARLYSGLALSHPESEAYREAARILTESTKESHR